jgi:hypothetical protein
VRRLVLASLLAAFGILVAAQAALAQEPSTTVIHIGDSVVALTGPWKFSVGDSPLDPATHKPLWASPAFDDSHWESVDLNPKAGATDPMGGFADFVPGWTAKGHPGYWGYAWYRIRVHVESHPGIKLALAGPSDVDDAYQIFDNGAYVGSFGDFSSTQPSILYSQPMMFDLPRSTITGDGGGETTRVFAFRVWMQPSTLTQGDWVGGLHTPPLLGEAEAVAARHQVLWDSMIRTYLPQPVQGLFFGALGLLALSLFLFDRTDRVYLWIGALLLVISIGNIEAAIAVWGSWLSGNFDVVFNSVVLYSLQYAGWVMVWRVWFRLRRPAWIPWALLPLTLLLMVSTLGFQNLLPGAPVSAGHAFTLISLAVRFILAAFMLITVIQGIREQGGEGWLALPAVILAAASEFYTDLSFMHILPFWFPFGVRIRLPEIADLLLVIALTILLLRRLRQSITRQRLIALDLKQAQEVQRVLIPEAIPSVPGFTMQAIYKPAGEVGGDFFQILPTLNGGVLIVIGDVSGKGTPAAMTVSLLVGTIRTLAHYTQSPGEILAAMNYRMLARSNGGFTTCLVLRIDLDGTLTAANAGHLPPYLNGTELPVDYNLPLGLSAGSSYTESTAQLSPDQQLTLLTDGVVEAQSASGELFGFDRTAGLSRRSAETIAHYAQQYGQKDDITVLTLTLQPAPVAV